MLKQLANIRAALFNYRLSLDFATRHLRERLFEQRPKMLPHPVAPTREFCVGLFVSKIEATIGDIGDMIGWESDNEVVGAVAFAAKQSIIRAIPYILPAENSRKSLYRLVLEHGDFGIHNTSIVMGTDGRPCVTSLYDWETGCVAPAILSDPLVAVSPVDLIVDEKGRPAITRIPDGTTAKESAEYVDWAKQYTDVCVFGSFTFGSCTY